MRGCPARDPSPGTAQDDVVSHFRIIGLAPAGRGRALFFTLMAGRGRLWRFHFSRPPNQEHAVDPQSPPPPQQPPYPGQPQAFPGQPQAYPGAPGAGAYAQPPRTSLAAVMSLVCGILGCIPLITSILAVLLGIVGIVVTRDPRRTGRGLAIAGLILGLIGVVGWTALGGGLWTVYVTSRPVANIARQFTT